MVEPGETVLSDVHVKCKSKNLGDGVNPTFVSRFPFRVKRKISSGIQLWGKAVEGGDETAPEFFRHNDVDSDVVFIRHFLQTSLNEVGLQVWNGCLLLADFLLTHPHLSQTANETWLELGAGTGLSSIVAALSRSNSMPAERIICTDTGDKVLDVCRQNLRGNIALLKDRSIPTKLCAVEVDFLNFDDEDRRTDVYDACTDEFDRGVALLPLLRQASVILAADVIFDADVTEGFFQLLVETMTVPVDKGSAMVLLTQDCPELNDNPPQKLSKTLYLALEKRVLFSIYEDEPSSPIYDHFEACLEGLLQMKFETGCFKAVKIDIDFPQCFYKSYERSDYLEIWRISFYFYQADSVTVPH